MDREVLEKRLREYQAQEQTAMVNFHRVQGARIAIEQLLKEMAPPPDVKEG